MCLLACNKLNNKHYLIFVQVHIVLVWKIVLLQEDALLTRSELLNANVH